MPTIRQDKEQQLQGKGNQHGRHHQHAQSHQDAGDNDVHDEEGHGKEEADLKARPHLAEDEGRNEDGRRDIFRAFRVGQTGDAQEQSDVLFPHLTEHEPLEGTVTGGDGLLGVQFALQVRSQTVFIGCLQSRCHHEERQEKRHANEDGIGRRLRCAQRHPQQTQDDDDASEASHDGKQKGR